MIRVRIRTTSRVLEGTIAVENRFEQQAPEIGERLLNRIATKLLEGKSGRTYKLAGGATHIASASGEAPAVMTGALLAGLEVVITRRRVSVVEHEPHGVLLELGTSTMEARPFLRPALLESRDDVAEALRR